MNVNVAVDLTTPGQLPSKLVDTEGVTNTSLTDDKVTTPNSSASDTLDLPTVLKLYQELQDRVQQLEETLALSDGQYQILESIAQGKPLAIVLEELALLIESKSKQEVYCSFLFVEDGKRLRHAAAPSLPEEYNAKIDGIEIGPMVGSCGTAAYHKASVIVEDIATDPLWAKFHIALDYGLKACWSTPILSADGTVLATFAMYHPFCYKPTNHDRELLAKATYLARIAIERHLVEITLRQQAKELEQALKNLQQTQMQLVQKEKMSALGNLVAGVAHEINNPVGFLSGNLPPAQDYVRALFKLLDLYQQEYPHPSETIEHEIEAVDLNYLREDLPKLLGSMQVGVKRIHNISTSLRTFSRADKDYKVPFNIQEGLDSTLLILKHRLKANDDHPAIDVVTQYRDLPIINCFPGQLNQVFMNILANAIDALEEANQGRSFTDIAANPNRITIQTLQLDDKWVKIQIADNGTGMTEEIKQRIFDYLFTTKAVGKGTGLGLALVHQIVVEKHGGEIEVNSVLGQGTEFAIVLPLIT
ncbi:sensor histidine kinase [Scytonema sp. NUACC26]|uniref:sensor histidine kinase n=1 Tax=Scytonema sp. NUACC26 TaxID=3140176 RepID=UPI0038B368C8